MAMSTPPACRKAVAKAAARDAYLFTCLLLLQNLPQQHIQILSVAKGIAG